MSTQEQQATRDVKANGTPANAAEAKEDTAEIRDDAGATTAPPQPQDDGVTAEGAVQGHDARNSELGPSTEGQTASSDQTGKAEANPSAAADRPVGPEEKVISVNTSELITAIQTLMKFGRVVLCGPPRSGKTTLAQALLSFFKQKGYAPTFTTEVCGACRRSLSCQQSAGSKRICLVDGLMGDVRCSKSTFQSCQSFLFNTQQLLSKTEFNALLVVTIYPHILKDLHNLDYGSHSCLADPRVIVHLEHDPITPSLPFVPKAEYFVPLIYRMLRDHTSGNMISALMGLTMLGYGGFLYDPPKVQDELVRFGYKEVSCYRLEEYSDLLRGFLFPTDEYGFRSRALYEAAGLALGRSFAMEFLLKVCDAKFLADYIRIDVDGKSTLTSLSIGDKPYHKEMMLERMYDMMVKGALMELCQHPSLAYQEVVREFADFCSERKNFTERLMSAVDTSHGLPLLYWSVWNSSIPLNYWCLTTMAQQVRKGKVLSEALLSALLASILFAESGDSTLVAARDFVKELVNLKFKPSADEVTLTLPVPTHRKEDTKERLDQVKTRLRSCLRYLEDPELPIPSTLLSVSVSEDAISLQLPSSQHWYLLLRLLTDKEKEEKDENGNTVLHVAASTGDPETIKMLVKSGASLTARNKKGLTPPHVARKSKKPAGKEARSTEESNLRDLHVACQDGDSETVKVLLCLGGNLQGKDDVGNTPLHAASQKGRSETVALLLQLQADVNAKTGEGRTPLHEASASGHLDTARLLVDHGADVSAKTRQGSTALHLACRGGHTGVAALLLQHHVDVNSKDQERVSPLHLASRGAHTDTVRLLLQLHADVNAKDGGGATALHAACQGRHAEAVSRSSPTQRNAVDGSGKTEPPHAQVVLLLLQHDAEVAVEDSSGRTPADIVRRLDPEDPVSQQVLSRAI